MDDVRTLVRREEKKRRAEEFQAWCEDLDRFPRRFKPRVKGDFVGDTEFQPLRWLRAGKAILEGAASGNGGDLDDGANSVFQNYLPYSVFLSGAEIFLKGMWLCQFPACRRIRHNSYVNEAFRKRYFLRLKSHGHDLLGLVGRLRRLRVYRNDPVTMRFLERLSAVIRMYYYPLYQADKNWASARYPKRFYDDREKIGAADAVNSYPNQWLVIGLFRPMETHLDRLWGLRHNLQK